MLDFSDEEFYKEMQKSNKMQMILSVCILLFTILLVVIAFAV